MPVPVTPTWSLNPNALVTVQTVKDELGLANSDTSADQRLVRMINAASEACENWCGRDFSRVFMAAEPYSMSSQLRGPRLYLRRFPLVNAFSVESISTDLDPGPAAIVDATSYYIEDIAAASIFMVSRFRGTSLRRGDVAQDFEPGTEEATIAVAYSGGFVTQPQLDAAIGVQWVAATVYHVGDLLNPSANGGTQIWMCTKPGTSGPTTQPAWGASPTKGVTTQADTGTSAVIWTYQGVKATNDGKTLPVDLEGAAIDAVVSFWRRRGQSLEVQSERLGAAQLSYGGTSGAGRLILPSAVQDTLDSYRVYA